MYHQYFGLSEAPFSIAVNPRYLFMSPRHRDALAHLLYGVGSGGGFILLTGEVGTGKTTINRALLEQMPEDSDVAIILNPALNALELLASALDELNIEYDADKHTLKTLTDKLHTFLVDNHARGRNTVLMIDEAQHLDFDVLEQIRLLTNLETHSRKLLQIILIGQPELSELLNQPELRQLNQRITARYNLEPLNEEETGAYIRHRLKIAGLSPGRELFPARVIKAIYKTSRGIPRIINVLCDRILLGTYGRNKSRADMTVFRIAEREVLGKKPAGAWQGKRYAAIGFAALSITLMLGYGLTQLVPASVWNPPSSGIAGPTSATTAFPEQPVVREGDSLAEPTDSGAWLLPPEQSLESLWMLVSSMPAPVDSCPEEPIRGLQCVRSQAATWDALREMDRPLALEMITPDRFGASVLLVDLDGSNGLLLEGKALKPVPLAELGRLWSGYFSFLWHPPEGFSVPLSLGDSSPVVAVVAELFARLDGQANALTSGVFNRPLMERVRMFQAQHGLEADGVIGLRTLLKLNEQVGVDMTRAGAREQLEKYASEAVTR